jgi:hypothetical protein
VTPDRRDEPPWRSGTDWLTYALIVLAWMLVWALYAAAFGPLLWDLRRK